MYSKDVSLAGERPTPVNVLKIAFFFFALLLLMTLAPGAAAQTVDLGGTRTATLYWTAPGDDGMSGRASRYQIRIAYVPIGDSNWTAATPLSNVPTPGEAGATDSLLVEGLAEGVNYYVAMKAADEVPNWSSLSNNIEILIPAKAVEPDFAASPTTGTAPLAVQFTDNSTGDPQGWLWDFGDGGTSSAANPQYTYDTPGTYSVSLTVWNASDTQTVARAEYIVVEDSVVSVNPDFAANPTTGIAPLAVQFADQSSGGPVGRRWDFGDGGTSSLANPLYTYDAPGSYTVSLTVWNSSDTQTVTRTGYITVEDLVVDDGEALYPYSETAVAGQVDGSYTDLTDLDGRTERIREEESGGKPDLRHSLLEHQWLIDVPESQSLSFHVWGSRSDNAEGDDFLLEYSVDGAGFRSLVAIRSATIEHYEAYLPADVSGTVTIRIVDTDHSEGNRVSDVVAIDRMYIERGGTSVTPDTVYVDRIETGQVGNPSGKFRAQACVYVLNSRGFPASGVDVYGHFEGVVDGSSVVATRSDGCAAFESKLVHYPDGEWNFFVDSLEAYGRVYSSGLNLANDAAGRFDAGSLPVSAELFANYPNPFNPETNIAFWIPSSGHVTLTIYNTLGQRVETLLDEVLASGSHSVAWEATGYASGPYFYRLTVDDQVETKKMMLLK